MWRRAFVSVRLGVVISSRGPIELSLFDLSQCSAEPGVSRIQHGVVLMVVLWGLHPTQGILTCTIIKILRLLRKERFRGVRTVI
jgi:hypothetical protein